MVIYLDTSALIKLYIRENGSETVQSLVESQDDPLPIWELQEAELINALRLKVFWGDISDSQADDQIAHFDDRKRRGLYFTPLIDRVEMNAKVRELSRETPRLGCRTMDILHVACALQLNPSSFISFDQRQRSLAKYVDLDVEPRISAD